MARPREFKVAAIAELYRQIRFASDDARLRQMQGAELLAREVNPSQNYPEAFIIYRITAYRPDDQAQSLLVGEALLGDLATFVQRLSGTLALPADHQGRKAISMNQAAQRLGVTERSVQRYRRQGLVCHEVVVDCRREVVCFEDALQHFAQRQQMSLNGDPVMTRIDPDVERSMIAQARMMRSEQGLTLHAAARRLAGKHGRAVETVRNVLKRHDHSGDDPIFTDRGPITKREQRAIARAHRMGIEPAALAERYGRSRKTMYRVLVNERVRSLRSLTIEAIVLPTFALPDAGDVLLSAPIVRTHLREPPPCVDAITIIQRSKAQSPLDSAAEAAVLGAYNFLKHRARQTLDDLPRLPTVDQVDAIETDLRWAALLKRNLVHHAMRIGLTTIERTLTRPLVSQSAEEISQFIPLGVEVISRAIETVDVGRGHSLERVCSFAVDRRMARLQFTPMSHRAAARHGDGEVAIVDPLAAVCPWQRRLDLPADLTGRVHRLADDDAHIVIRHFGLDGASPVTCQSLATLLHTTSTGISRRLRRAVLELKQCVARDRARRH